MGVEFFDIGLVGEGVAGAEGKNREGGGPKDILGEAVSAGDSQRAPSARIKEDGLVGVAGVFLQHEQVLAIIGVVSV